MRLPRMKQTELSQFLKKITLKKLLGAAILYYECLFKICYGSDKIYTSNKLKPKPVGHCSSFQFFLLFAFVFCLETSHSL